MATLGAATFDDCPAGPGAHAGTEAVLTLAAPYIGLIGTFHSEGSPDRGVGGRRQVTKSSEALSKTIEIVATPSNRLFRLFTSPSAKSSRWPRKKELGPNCRFRGKSALAETHPKDTISIVGQAISWIPESTQ
jgi:hypothetical protein